MKDLSASGCRHIGVSNLGFLIVPDALSNYRYHDLYLLLTEREFTLPAAAPDCVMGACDA